MKSVEVALIRHVAKPDYGLRRSAVDILHLLDLDRSLVQCRGIVSLANTYCVDPYYPRLVAVPHHSQGSVKFGPNAESQPIEHYLK